MKEIRAIMPNRYKGYDRFQERQSEKNAVHLLSAAAFAFLAAMLALVYNPLRVGADTPPKPSSAQPSPQPAPGRDVSTLPPETQRMRQAILAAAASGDIAALRVPMDMNEIPPVVASSKVPDPVAYWKEHSGDGEGRETLAILIKLFRTGWAIKDAGTDHEMYIWPYFAEMPLDKLTPQQEVELLTLVTPEKLKEMRQKGKYDYYKVGISKKGIWHFFLEETKVSQQ